MMKKLSDIKFIQWNVMQQLKERNVMSVKMVK